MKYYLRHIFAAFALLSYSFGGVLIELTHHDEIAVLLRSKPVLETHDCGAKEIHIAWEDARHCVACSHFTQRLSTEASAFLGADASVYLLAVLSTLGEQTLETDILYSGKRGPPSFSSLSPLL
jgi:hypothetical protein